jgi:hypothetical protein
MLKVPFSHKNQKHISHMHIYIYIYFGGTVVWTKDLAFDRSNTLFLSYTPSPYVSVFKTVYVKIICNTISQIMKNSE